MSSTSKPQSRDPELVDVESATETTTPAPSAVKGDNANIRHPLALGGLAGILAGVTYIVGFCLFGAILRDIFEEDKLGSVESVELLKENEAVFYTANFLVYIFNGLLQVVFACVLYQYLSKENANMPQRQIYIQIAAVIGCIWGALVVAAGMIGNGGAKVAVNLYDTDPQRAATLWLTVDAIYTDGIGGGNEILGAVWVAMVSFLSWGCGVAFPKPLNVVGVVAGLAGLVTVVPGMDEATAFFGILMIVWYILAGAWLLRGLKQT